MRVQRYDDATEMPYLLNVISSYSTYPLESDTWNRDFSLLGLFVTK